MRNSGSPVTVAIPSHVVQQTNATNSSSVSIASDRPFCAGSYEKNIVPRAPSTSIIIVNYLDVRSSVGANLRYRQKSTLTKQWAVSIPPRSLLTTPMSPTYEFRKLTFTPQECRQQEFSISFHSRLPERAIESLSRSDGHQTEQTVTL